MTHTTDKKPESILVCCIRVIGDVILTTPLIGILKSAYPDAAIDMLVAAGSGSFLKRDPRIRSVIEASSKEIAGARTSDTTFTIQQRIFRQYDLAITMNAGDRGNMFVLCAGRKQQVGFYEQTGFLKNFWKKWLFSTPLLYNTSCHTAYLGKIVADALRLPSDNLHATIYWNDEDSSVVDSHLTTLPPAVPYVVMHPFARWDYKYWPMDSFVALNDALVEKFGVKTVWTASPAPTELDLLDRYAVKCTHQPLAIRGSLTLNQMACLIAGSALYIGLDTAITHIAATTDVPVVALYGPTATHRWFPWNNNAPADQYAGCERGSFRNGQIMLLQEDCLHPSCIRTDCQRPCLPRITPEKVLAAVEQLLVEYGITRKSLANRT